MKKRDREDAIKEASDLVNENMVKERSIERLQEKIDTNRKRLAVLQHFIQTGEIIRSG